MEIKQLHSADNSFIDQAAALLANAFNDYKHTAREEVVNCITSDKIALVAVSGGKVLGVAGAMAQYGKTGWELHPLVVDSAHKCLGIGSLLLKHLEAEVKLSGGVTIYLGTDDENFATSLSDSDLFVDTFDKIKNIKNYKNHPYEFYQKNGYQIVGVIPNANGYNKPDIYMAKPL